MKTTIGSANQVVQANHIDKVEYSAQITSDKSNDNKKKSVLILSANPEDKSTVKFDSELRVISNALKSSKYIDEYKLEIESKVKWNEIPKLLRTHTPSILHITMHSNKSKGLLLENENGNGIHYVSAEVLNQMLSSYQNKYQNLKFVFISACNSLQHASEIRGFVDYSIGMQDDVGVNAAIIFADNFYSNFFDTLDIEHAFTEAKSMLKYSDISSSSIAFKPFEIPVLIKNNKL